jgi:hypothetical protein
LAPAAAVDYLPRLIAPELMAPYYAYAYEDAFDADKGHPLEGAICVSPGNEAQIFLLLPPQANSWGEGWGYWFFASWVPGEWVQQGFRYWAEDELRRLMDGGG